MTQTAESRLRQLQAATKALASATTRQRVVEALFTEALAAVGAVSGGLWLLNDDDTALEWGGGAGIEASIPQRFAAIPLSSGLPAVDVVSRGEAITYSSSAERDQRWPILAGTPTSAQAVAALPLTAAGSTFGCLAVAFAEEREFDDDDVAFLAAVADQAAIAVDRARLFESERAGADLLRYLADASSALTATLDPLTILSELCRLAVPRLADWAAAYLPRGDQLDRVAVWVGGDPEEALALVNRWPTAADSAAPTATAFRTGVVQPVPDVTPETVAMTSTDREFMDLVFRLGMRSGVAIPITGPDRTLAVITLGFLNNERALSPQLLDVARDLCQRAGSALATAELYQRQRRIATTLTAAVLPPRPHTTPGVEVAAVYEPVDEDAGDVGGDWFDSWPLPDGRLLIGVGDVSGHGIEAATRMAQLRHAARGWSLHDADPGSLLAHLNDVATTDPAGDDHFATAIYGVFDPRTGGLAWASAGHPPPVLASPTDAGPLEDSPGLALGVEPNTSFDVHHAVVDAGAVLVLYTDGVVEQPGVHLDEGIAVVVQQAREAAARTDDVDEVCAAILANCGADRVRQDDCCILILRRA